MPCVLHMFKTSKSLVNPYPQSGPLGPTSFKHHNYCHQSASRQLNTPQIPSVQPLFLQISTAFGHSPYSDPYSSTCWPERFPSTGAPYLLPYNYFTLLESTTVNILLPPIVFLCSQSQITQPQTKPLMHFHPNIH